MLCLLAAILLSVAPNFSTAEPLVIGVQTHFGFEPARTDVGAFRSWVQRSRFTSSRDEMFWWYAEDASGALGLRDGAVRSQQVWASMPGPFAGLLIVDFGHPSYDSGGQPKSDQGRAAFARYASFVTFQRLAAPDLQVVPQGRFATVRLGPGGVHVIDVPAGAALQVEELQ